MATILYSARSQLTPEHQLVVTDSGNPVYIRAVDVPGTTPLEALSHFAPMAGETTLNGIED